jgi:hypothetical protein
MCNFLTIGVLEQYSHTFVEVFARGYSIHWMENASILAAFPSGFTTRVITDGHCSCGFFRDPVVLTNKEEKSRRLRHKYAKLRWSQAKIDRAIAHIEAAHLKDERINPAWFGLRADIVERLSELCRLAGSIAAVIHMYHGEIEQEPFTLKRTPVCHCNELAERAAVLVEDEILHAVSRKLARSS